jgi:hypothetical protein
MTKESAIQLFEQKQVRSLWDNEQEKWYFSIVDVVGILTDSSNPNIYWKVLKNRLKKEGSELVTNCNQVKMKLKFSNQPLFWVDSVMLPNHHLHQYVTH